MTASGPALLRPPLAGAGGRRPSRRFVAGARRGLFAAGLLVLLGALAHAAEPRLETEAAAVPQTLDAGLQRELAPQVLRLVSAERVTAEIWLRRRPALAATPARGLGIGFGELEQGSLVGIVRFPQAWTDYRAQPVPAGTYGLRYAVQPADGNHMGVSLYRDFLVLVPPVGDPPGEDGRPYDELLELARQISGQPHPYLMGLFPAGDAAEAPALRRNELGHAMLAVRFGPAALGIVLEGHEGAEGY